MVEFKNRPYQDECVKIGLEVLRDIKGRREIIVAVTASGKSVIIAGIAKELTCGNVLVLQPDKTILMQNLIKIESFGVKPSVYSAGLGRKELGHLIYATPKSLSYNVLKDANIKHVIWDEVDYSSKNDSHAVKLLQQLGIKSVLGLTASPLHTDSSGQDGSVARIMTRIKKPYFTDICYVVTSEEMVSQKYWSPIKYYNAFKEEGNKFLKLNSNKSDYTEESVEDFFNNMNLAEEVKSFLLRMPKNENALVFVPSIDNLEHLQSMIEGSVGVHSKLSAETNSENIDGFKSGKYKIMISVHSLNVGFDFPQLYNLVDCSPTNSVRIIIQRYGRILRVHKDKEFGKVICFSGNYKKFGKAEELNFDNIDNYGWGLFRGDVLLTDVVLDAKEVTTKEYLRLNGKPKSTQFFFNDDVDGLVCMKNGKMKGIPLKRLYFTKRFYLKWLVSSGFKFKNEDEEFERQLKEIYGKV